MTVLYAAELNVLLPPGVCLNREAKVGGLEGFVPFSGFSLFHFLAAKAQAAFFFQMLPLSFSCLDASQL